MHPEASPRTRRPRPLRRGLGLAIVIPFVVAACGATASVTVDSAATPSDPSETIAQATAEATPPAAVAAAAVWRDIELTDAASGETFTLASLEGQPVAIDPMAVWCTNCKQQNDNVKAAYPELRATGIRWISLGVEPNESTDRLARYAERRGYPWTFAQSPIEMSRALNDIFGPQILAVPATPLILLDETGEIVYQDYGFHGPDSLVELVNEVLG